MAGLGGGGEYADSVAPVPATVSATIMPVAGTSAIQLRCTRSAAASEVTSSAPAAKKP